MTTKQITAPRAAFTAEATVPGDKSLSHRAFILSAMASGRSEVVNAGTGRDVAATIQGIRALGVQVEGSHVTSPGVEGSRMGRPESFPYRRLSCSFWLENIIGSSALRITIPPTTPT